MPVGELIEFGVRLTIVVISEVGAGDSLAAARTRVAVHALLAVVSASCLWLVLPVELAGGTSWLVFLATIFFIFAGAWLVRRAAQDVYRLRHWGEPEISASDAGLKLAKRGQLIPWDDIASVTPERRGARGRVRICLKSQPGTVTFIATRNPDALAAAILADEALIGLRR